MMRTLVSELPHVPVFYFSFLSLPSFSCLSCLIFTLALVGASLFLLPTLISLSIVMTNLLFPKCVFMTQIRRVAPPLNA